MEVGRRLASVIRPGDTLARIAGDEFVILCEGVTSRSEVPALVRRLRSSLEKPIAVNAHSVQITASFGVAYATADTPPGEQLLRDADAAMYRAKQQRGETGQIIDLTEAEQRR